jgi:hypothetical protein
MEGRYVDEGGQQGKSDRLAHGRTEQQRREGKQAHRRDQAAHHGPAPCGRLVESLLASLLRAPARLCARTRASAGATDGAGLGPAMLASAPLLGHLVAHCPHAHALLQHMPGRVEAIQENILGKLVQRRLRDKPDDLGSGDPRAERLCLTAHRLHHLA